MRFILVFFADVVVGSMAVVVLLVLWNLSHLESSCGLDTNRILMWRVDEVLTMYAAKHKGHFPEELDAAQKYWPGGEPIRDAFGRPFHYLRGETDCGGYWLVSLGSDGRWGGEGQARDLDNCRVLDDFR